MLNVLCACEESQAVCIAFRELGHNAFSCDIQPCSGGHPEWHIQGDVLELIEPVTKYDWNEYITFETLDGEEHWIEGNWDLIIAFPPCTYLTKAGAVRMRVNGQIQEERYQKMLDGRNFFLSLLNCGCPHVAVENPTPLALAALPPYDQAIEPWMFGHPYKKRTCLWLRGLPPLMPTLLIYDDLVPWVNGGLGNGRKCQGQHRSQKMRSKTFPGIAAAMAAQWSDYIESRKNVGCFN